MLTPLQVSLLLYGFALPSLGAVAVLAAFTATRARRDRAWASAEQAWDDLAAILAIAAAFLVAEIGAVGWAFPPRDVRDAVGYAVLGLSALFTLRRLHSCLVVVVMPLAPLWVATLILPSCAALWDFSSVDAASSALGQWVSLLALALAVLVARFRPLGLGEVTNLWAASLYHAAWLASASALVVVGGSAYFGQVGAAAALAVAWVAGRDFVFGAAPSGTAVSTVSTWLGSVLLAVGLLFGNLPLGPAALFLLGNEVGQRLVPHLCRGWGWVDLGSAESARVTWPRLMGALVARLMVLALFLACAVAWTVWVNTPSESDYGY